MQAVFFMKVRCRQCNEVAIKPIEFAPTGSGDQELADAVEHVMITRKTPVHHCGLGIVGMFEVIAAAFDRQRLE